MKTPRRQSAPDTRPTDPLSLREAEEIGKAIVGARKRAGMTQVEIAKAMGITQGTVATLESGRSLPRLSTLQRLARATSTQLILSFDPVSNHDRIASHVMTDTVTRPKFSTNRRAFLGGAVGLAGLLGLGSVRTISAEEATAAASAVESYRWTPPDYDPEPALFTIIDRDDEIIQVETIDGLTELPANPERVVSLGWEYIPLFELGVSDRLVGIPYNTGVEVPLWNVGNLTDSMHHTLANVALIPDPWELDFEQILKLSPDLILTTTEWPENGSLLAEIAATIRSNTNALNLPRASVRDFGELFDQSLIADTLINDHETYIARAKQEIATTTKGKKASVIWPAGDNFYVYPSYSIVDNEVHASGYGAYQLHRELRITPSSMVEGLADEDREMGEVGFSMEQIGLIDTDYMFVWEYEGSVDSFMNHPLVQRTTAFRENLIFAYDGDKLGFGLAGVRAAVAYMVECITGEPFE